MILLGATGSIGESTLEIIKKFSLTIDVLVAGYNIKKLNSILKNFSPRLVIIADEKDIKNVMHKNVKSGENAILEAIEMSSSKLVVNALVGFIGLKPTLKAIECGKTLALANKESLVVAGKFINTKNIIPIDSEHFGLWYLKDSTKKIDSMTITASGGSFRDYPLEKLNNVTVKEALQHPNWSMGNKITIDSATMTNKLFELIEARWLFNIQKCDAIIEKNSIIHALIHYIDGSTTAHIADVSMQLPIAFAILEKVQEPILSKVDLTQLSSINFEKIQSERYPIWEFKDELLHNENLGVILNAANEIAVQKFLEGKISFLEISQLNKNALNYFHATHISSIEHIFEIDKEVRRYLL